MSGTQSISRAINLLRILAGSNNQGMHLTQIARKVELHIATTRRILTALVDEGILSFDPLTKLYRLGYELFSLGNKANQYNLKNQFNGVIQQIAQETEECVFLIIRSGLNSICIDTACGDYPVRVETVVPGTIRPMGLGAGSIILLANMPETQINEIISANEDRYKEFDAHNADEIRQLVARSKKTGFSYFTRNNKQGGYVYTAVGVPVYSQDNEVIAAISVTAIPSRMSLKRRKQVVTIIKSKIAALKIIS